MVSRIPFHHPVQIYTILQVVIHNIKSRKKKTYLIDTSIKIQCLRQQQMFNTLFKSVFNATNFRKEANQSIRPISLSLSDILAGNFFFFF